MFKEKHASTFERKGSGGKGGRLSHDLQPGKQKTLLRRSHLKS